MKIKRIISGVLAVVMLASLSACSNGDDSKTTTTTGNRPTDVEPPVKEVVETLGNFDPSDYVMETGVDPNFKLEFEAEDGILSGNAVVSELNFLGEFTGTGFVSSLINETSAVEFEADFESTGVYTISLRASGDSVDKTGAITIDGVQVSTFMVKDNSAFFDVEIEGVNIEAGTHKIGVKYASTPIYLDNLTITPNKGADPAEFNITSELTNPNASETTRRLYNFLKDCYGNYIISGNYAGGDGANSREFKEIYRNCNDYPAIIGLDLMALSPSGVSHGSGSNVISQAIEWDQKGGIVTFCWHWYAPEDYLGVNDQPWWRGFYTEATSFNLKAALDGTDPKGYDFILRDIDAIAEELKELEALDIPILWRPLHEAGGDHRYGNTWFWWGASGGEAYKELWILMYDRLTNYHNINNLIWVWNGQRVDWYPGDEYVDMISFDVYAEAQDTSSQKYYFDYLKQVSTNKIIALSENGVIPDPDQCFGDGSVWSWFAVWTGEFTIKDAQLSGQYTPLDMWKKVYSHERVLTLSELPDLKSYPLDTEAYLDAQGK